MKITDKIKSIFISTDCKHKRLTFVGTQPNRHGQKMALLFNCDDCGTTLARKAPAQTLQL